MSTPVSIAEDVFVNEITFEFPNKILLGTTDLFLLNSTDPLTAPVEKVILSGDILTSMVDGKVPKGTAGTITISYSEGIPFYSLSVLTFVVEGYTVTAISYGVNNSEVVLSIKANSDNTPARTTVRQVYNIIDYSENYFLPDKAWTVRWFQLL